MQNINRRKFIKTASAIGSSLAIKSSLGIAGGSELATSPYVIVIHCDGGWDPTLVFDDKIASSYIETQLGSRSAIGKNKIPYVDHASRPSVKEFFDTYGDLAAIVNGLHAGSMSHDHAKVQSSGTLMPETSRYVDWMSFYAVQVGAEKTFPHMVIDAPQFPGIYGEYSSRLTTSTIAKYKQQTLPIADALTQTSESALTTYLNTKYSKLLENKLNETIDSEKLQTLQGGYIHELSMPAAIEKHEVTSGKSDFSNNLNFAVELLKSDLAKCITIQAGTDKLWDTHENNDTTQSLNFEMLFSAILEAANTIEASPLKGQVTIIVKSEMGRTAKVNSNLKKGKDHWPYTSTLLWGAGINGGKSFGATDDRLRGIPINPIFGTVGDTSSIPLEMTNIFAALYNLFGIPYTLIMPDTVPASMLLSAGA